MPNILENGTVIHNGMMKTLVHGSSEFALASFAYLSIRAQFVDFFPIITLGSLGIFVPANMKNEEVNWKLYFNIFLEESWMLILTISIISGSISFISHSIYRKKYLVPTYFSILTYISV